MDDFKPPFDSLRKVRNAIDDDILSLVSLAGLDAEKDLRWMNLQGVEWAPGEISQVNTEGALLGTPLLFEGGSEATNDLGYSTHNLKISGNMATDQDDIAYAYQTAAELSASAKSTTDLEIRREARRHLQNIIDHGLSGLVDPNTLFNSAVTASRLDFDQEAILLATLCEKHKPSPSHRMLEADLQSALGVAFDVVDGEFVKSAKTQEQVRQEAIAISQIEVLLAPREQSEIVYSRASNIANRNRENGAISGLIENIEASTDRDSRASRLKAHGIEVAEPRYKTLTSYAHVTLAQLHALRSDPGWRDKYRDEVITAIRLLSEESPIATWYDSSVRELRSFAARLNMEEDVLELSASEGFDLASAATSQGIGDMAQLLEMIQKNSEQG